MKRTISILLVCAFFLTLVGCKSNNELFTDEFFEDIVEIYTVRHGIVSGEQMKPIIECLKELKLKKTNELLKTEDEDGDPLIGNLGISFKKADGSDIFMEHNGVKIYGHDGYAYEMINSDENNNIGTLLEEAFNKAHGEK